MSETKIAAWPRPPAEDEVRGLLERARGGDATDLEALREALDRHPEIWQSYGDLAMHARNAWIDLIAGTNLALKESMTRQVEAMRAELAGPAPSPLEALLVERIVACWLQLGHADAAVAQAGNVSIQQAEHARKRQDSAHRRYLTAVGALAMTRRLLAPAAGPSGRGPQAELPPVGPGFVVGSDRMDPALGDQGAIRVEGGPAELGPVLGFGPSGEGEVDGGRPGRRGKPRIRSRS